MDNDISLWIIIISLSHHALTERLIIVFQPVVSLLTSQDPLVNPFWQDPYLFLVSQETGMMFKYDEKGNTSNIVNTSIGTFALWLTNRARAAA